MLLQFKEIGLAEAVFSRCKLTDGNGLVGGSPKLTIFLRAVCLLSILLHYNGVGTYTTEYE